jgi:light-regulated signal transduction histidine kinase (bacteriophytochrome)
MRDLARHALVEAGGLRSPAHVEIGPLPEAFVDPVLLRQVWVNLLSNALKYSGPRGDDARVDVAGERVGDHVRYTVRDNGVGFDMQYADKLFGVFQRLHPHEDFEGTGVGLAIVERILARHGGRVSADATPGRGAAFTIELPAEETAA